MPQLVQHHQVANACENIPSHRLMQYSKTTQLCRFKETTAEAIASVLKIILSGLSNPQPYNCKISMTFSAQPRVQYSPVVPDVLLPLHREMKTSQNRQAESETNIRRRTATLVNNHQVLQVIERVTHNVCHFFCCWRHLISEKVLRFYSAGLREAGRMVLASIER